MNDTLRSYIQTGSSDAFAKIVEAHVDAVYSQCRRQLRDHALAQDVTQMVFIALAKKAASIPDHVVLGGWLFKATRYCCRNVQRSEMRRRKRERKVASMRSETIHASGADPADQLLDDAIAVLNDRDRDAILLRYFQGQSMRQLAEGLRISEDAAKQRISRAVERLRMYFADRGVAMPSASVVGLLATAVKPAAPNIAKAAIAIATTKTAAASLAKIGGTWWTLSAGKIAAAVVGAALITSAAIVGERIVLADASTPAMAQAAPAAARATQPMSQATPTDAMRKLSLAIRSDNETLIDACMTDDGTDPELAGMARAWAHEQAAVCRLQAAWAAKFNIPMNVPGFSFVMFPIMDGGMEKVFDKILQTPGGPQVKIDGNTAMVRITIPKEMFTGTGPDRDTGLAHWAGGMLVLSKVGDDWKLNTDRSFTIIMNINAPGSTNTKLVTAQKLGEALHDALDKVADDIENGTLASPADAANAAHSAAGQAFQDCGVAGCNTVILPVIGG